MKFCRMVDLGVHQAQGLAAKPKSENLGNAYLVDRLRDRAEIL